MKKYFKFFIVIVISSCFSLLFHITGSEAQAVDKDWTFDPKTSSLIPNYLGKVKVINGKANIGERELKKGSKVYPQDLVQTAEKSFVVIEMIDLTDITIGPKSEFKVEKWVYRTKNDREVTFSVIKGQWRALVKSKSKDDDQLKIKTSVISMGIRGTELLVNVNTVDGGEVTQVALLEGQIHFDGDLPANIKKDLLPGDYAIFEKNVSGLNQQEKKLTPDEMKSYQLFSAPEVHRLLELIDSVVLDKKSTTKVTEPLNVKNDQTTSELFLSKKNNSEKTDSSLKSFKKNLKILNSIREQNIKSN